VIAQFEARQAATHPVTTATPPAGGRDAGEAIAGDAATAAEGGAKSNEKAKSDEKKPRRAIEPSELDLVLMLRGKESGRGARRGKKKSPRKASPSLAKFVEFMRHCDTADFKDVVVAVYEERVCLNLKDRKGQESKLRKTIARVHKFLALEKSRISYTFKSDQVFKNVPFA
jgi:hypothetical protein